MKNTDSEYIKLLLPDFELSKKDCDFLSEYITKWLVDEDLDVDSNTIQMLNKNKDAIESLKTQYASNKIMNITERMIVLSQIANGDLSITEWKSTKDGPISCEKYPSFNERINAINALMTIEEIANISTQGEKKLIVDDIPRPQEKTIQNEVKNEEIK